MAVNQSRSLRMSLHEGATDGKYRKARPDTTPSPDSAQTLTERAGLHPDMNYGYITHPEAPVMVAGDGSTR